MICVCSVSEIRQEVQVYVWEVIPSWKNLFKKWTTVIQDKTELKIVYEMKIKNKFSAKISNGFLINICQLGKNDHHFLCSVCTEYIHTFEKLFFTIPIEYNVHSTHETEFPRVI